jgi:hypothetical protein
MPCRLVAAAHFLVALLLLPLCLFFGIAVGPVMAVAPLWLAFLGVHLWRGPTPRTFALLRATHWAVLVLAALLIYAGIAALQAAERSAAHGGGLLGAFGFLPIAIGCVLGVLATLTLILVRRDPVP